MAEMTIGIEGVDLEATLELPATARGVVVFAHGSGSSRLSLRNVAVADHLRETGAFGTLLFDLLTPVEDRDYDNRFDIGLLTRRLTGACRWLDGLPEASGLPIGLFGASTGAAAALRTATELAGPVASIVSRGGRPDLAADALPKVQVPTLLIVGGADEVVIQLNEQALAAMPAGVAHLEIVAGATHLFEEPGALEEVSRLTREWFERTLDGRS